MLVVGSGEVARMRMRSLEGTGAAITVVAPSVPDDLAAMAHTVHRRVACAADVQGMDFVLLCIDDPAASSELARHCRAAGITVNVADVKAECDVYFPALFRDGAVQIAVSTSGKGPGLAARIRDRIERELPSEMAVAVDRFARLRALVRRRDPAPHSAPNRMAWLRNWLAERTIEEIAAMDTGDVESEAAGFGETRPRRALPGQSDKSGI